MKQFFLSVCILISFGAMVYAGSHGGVTFKNDIRPLMERQCFACHGDHAPTLDEFDADKEKYEAISQGPRMTSYEQVKVFITGDDAGALMRRLDDGTNTEDGNPGNMNVYLGSTDEQRKENLSLFKKWVGHWTLKRSNELTREDMEKFDIREK